MPGPLLDHARTGPPTDEHFRKLERAYLSAPVNVAFAPTLLVRAGAAELTFEIRPEMHHAAGAAHGSVYFKALDDAAFFAANSLVADVWVLTASFNLYFLRPVSEGSVTAKGWVVQRTSRLILAEAELADGAGRRIAHGTGTFMESGIAIGPA